MHLVLRGFLSQGEPRISRMARIERNLSAASASSAVVFCPAKHPALSVVAGGGGVTHWGITSFGRRSIGARLDELQPRYG
jgi:hypothetical protein